jgi:hypothetical protein
MDGWMDGWLAFCRSHIILDGQLPLLGACRFVLAGLHVVTKLIIMFRPYLTLEVGRLHVFFFISDFFVSPSIPLIRMRVDCDYFEVA